MIGALAVAVRVVKTLRVAPRRDAPLAVLCALAILTAATPANADHGGPLRNAPMSPLTAALLFAGLALLVGAIVVVVVRVVTKDR